MTENLHVVAIEKANKKLQRLQQLFDRIVYLEQAEDEIYTRINVLMVRNLPDFADWADLEEEKAMSETRSSWITTTLGKINYESKKEETWQKSLLMEDEEDDVRTPWPIRLLLQ